MTVGVASVDVATGGLASVGFRVISRWGRGFKFPGGQGSLV